MNQDGWGQGGAGYNDRRLGGEDEQHVMQYVKIKGGNMPKFTEKMEHAGKHPHSMGELSEHLASEKRRHMHAMDHTDKHMQRHHSRHHDSQYGHETQEHHYDAKHSF